MIFFEIRQTDVISILYIEIIEKKNEGKQCNLDDMPQQLHIMPLCIKRAKFNDLQIMKQFCSAAAQEYFSALPVEDNEENDSD